MKKNFALGVVSIVVALAFCLMLSCGGEQADAQQAGIGAQFGVGLHNHSNSLTGGPVLNPTVVVYASSTQAITGPSSPVLAFDKTLYDPLSTHSNTTNNSRIVVPSGYSMALATCITEGTYTGANPYPSLTVLIQKNGSIGAKAAGIMSYIFGQTSAYDIPLSTTGGIPVTANDYLECKIYNSGTGYTWTTEVGAGYEPRFIVTFLP